MKATKTKKMLLTATILTMTACAGVDESNVPPTGDDTGSDMQPEPAGTVTIDSSDFVVDGSMWWTQSAAPRIHGTFAGPVGLTIQVKAGNAPAMTATLTGNEWSAQLAPESITTSNTTITVTLEEPSGVKIAVAHAIGLDSAPPAIVLMPSTVRDERADQIDFGTGDPIHSHVGPEADLGGGGCPSVYKYAYLMSATAPLYGSQTAPNDLAWHLKILDAKLDASSEQYRVRNSGGETLVNWTALPAADDLGVSTIKLTTTNVPQLATTSGQFFIDVRAKDQAALETTATFCFDHHPLAAPLEIAPIEIAANGTPSWSFAANSPISVLNGYELGGTFVEQRIVQHTAEPIVIELAGRADSVRYTKTYASGYVKFGERRIYEADALPLTQGPRTSTSGVALSYGQMAVLVDAATDEFLIAGLDGKLAVPPRAANEAPHAYRVEYRISQLADIRPASGAMIGEHTVEGHAFTGLAPEGGTDYACQPNTRQCVGHACTCMADVLVNATVLDAATLDITSPKITIKTSPAKTVDWQFVSTSSLPTVHWDAGVELAN